MLETKLMRSPFTLCGLLAAWLCAACTGASGSGVPDGKRLLTGRATLSSVSATGQRRALQVIAVYAASDCGAGVEVGSAAAGVKACALFGPPFDPGQQGSGMVGQPFSLLIPCDLAVNLLVQVEATSGGQSPGSLLALLTFADGSGGVTSLLSAEPQGCRVTPDLATDVIDLGAFTVPPDPSTAGAPAVLLGGAEGGTNPLSIVDSGGDEGVANLADPDDDGDGVPDASDADADGDGMQDSAQRFQAGWMAS